MKYVKNPENMYNFSDNEMIFAGSSFAGFSTLLEAGVSVGHEPNIGMAVGAMGILFGGYFVFKGAAGKWGEYLSLSETEDAAKAEKEKK